MTAYDVAAWTDFANTVAGGAAALAGLLFVGLSLNLSEVLKYPGVPARAIATLGLTVAILLTAIFVATPGQDHRPLAAEIALIGVATATMVIVGARQQRFGPHPARALSSMLLLLVPTLLLIAAAVSLWLQRGGGLYWVTAAVVTGFVSATANAWVVLVEIKR
jgi:modulator of FtsH protease